MVHRAGGVSRSLASMAATPRSRAAPSWCGPWMRL